MALTASGSSSGKSTTPVSPSCQEVSCCSSFEALDFHAYLERALLDCIAEEPRLKAYDTLMDVECVALTGDGEIGEVATL